MNGGGALVLSGILLKGQGGSKEGNLKGIRAGTIVLGGDQGRGGG